MSDECSICQDKLDDLTNGKPVNAHYGSSDCQTKSTGIQHIYHTKCIQTWVAVHLGLATCPICRCKVNEKYIQDLNREFNLFKWLHEKPALRYMADFVNNVHYLSGLLLILGILSLPLYFMEDLTKKPELIKVIERLYEAIPELKDTLVEFANIILSKDAHVDNHTRIHNALDMMWKKIESLEKDLLKKIQENRDIPHKYIELMKKPPKGMVGKYSRSQFILKHGEHQQNIESEKVVSSFLKGKEDTKRFLDELVHAVTSKQMDHLVESDRRTFKEKIFDRIIRNFDTGNAEHFAVLLLGRLEEEVPVWMHNTAPNSLVGAEHPSLNSADIYPLGVQGLENFRNEGRKPSLPDLKPSQVIKSPLAYLSLAGQPHYERLASKGGSKRMKRRRRRRFTYRHRK